MAEPRHRPVERDRPVLALAHEEVRRARRLVVGFRWARVPAGMELTCPVLLRQARWAPIALSDQTSSRTPGSSVPSARMAARQRTWFGARSSPLLLRRDNRRNAVTRPTGRGRSGAARRRCRWPRKRGTLSARHTVTADVTPLRQTASLAVDRSKSFILNPAEIREWEGIMRAWLGIGVAVFSPFDRKPGRQGSIDRTTCPITEPVLTSQPCRAWARSFGRSSRDPGPCP